MPGLWMTKTLETDTDNCQVLDYGTLEMEKIGADIWSMPGSGLPNLENGKIGRFAYVQTKTHKKELNGLYLKEKSFDYGNI